MNGALRIIRYAREHDVPLFPDLRIV